MQQTGPIISKIGLEAQGLTNLGAVHWNLDTALLIEHAIKREEGKLAKGGAFSVLTGEHTGRSANDKFIVKDDFTEADIDWGKVNKPVTPEVFDKLYAKVKAYYQGTELFVQDCYVGAHETHRLNLRVVTETAWHNLFARNMFIQPDSQDLANFTPAFTVLHAPGLKADPESDGTRSDVAVVISFTKKMILILGTWYAGEIKKSVFSILNHLLPEQGILPMHCSANASAEGDTAIFFGLSGTGKTTLSADASRTLVGDDEHGWSPDGVYNFEGGCYAKVIRLSQEAEPEIHATTGRFGTILENVAMDPRTRMLDLDSNRYTENTRASYPINFMKNASETGRSGQPKNIVMLTCDAFGVLPPISKLSPAQAMYHFLSGYTAKVAGTEQGVKEPTAAFSACFGAPFMPRHPTVYANLLGKLIAEHDTNCWLVNTGWSGGGYGVGNRISIKYTRALLAGALAGQLDADKFETDPVFGLSYLTEFEGVPSEVLNPKNTWSDAAAYDATAADVAARFQANFEPFLEAVSDDVKDAAIKTAKTTEAAE